MYDAASTILAQKFSQITGVGQVIVGGSSLPSVRVELNPTAAEPVWHRPRTDSDHVGERECEPPRAIFRGPAHGEIGANDQSSRPADYESLVVAYHNGSALRISDIGLAVDSVEDLRNSGYANGKPSVLVIIFRQPGANIIETVDRLRETLPQLHASIAQAIDMRVALDQTVTIRASVHEVELTLAIAVVLVLLVVFAFLRNPRTTLIPSVAVPVRLSEPSA